MDPVPTISVDNGLVLAWIRHTFVNRVAHIDPVVEQLADVALLHQLPCWSIILGPAAIYSLPVWRREE
jgi:hypothetical protein